MPGMVDAFASNMFDTLSMTLSIIKLPIVPNLIGSMNLFKPKPIATTTAVIEVKNGTLALVQTSQRGSGNNRQNTRDQRDVRSFVVPHIETFDTILAEASQGVRAFGSEDELEAVNDVVNERLTSMKQNLEATQEWHRAGACRGVLYDADGSTVLHDFFDEFDITEQVQDFAFSTTTTNIKQLCLNVFRMVGDALGQTPFKGIVALCSDGFFDALVAHPVVVAAYDKQNGGGQFLQTQQAGDGQTMQTAFTYGGITWVNYRGVVGTNYMIPVNTCRFVPVGVPDLFQVVYSPADYMETVNTLGKPYYAKQKILDYDKGVELEAQVNPLHMPTRPRCLVKGTKS